MVFLKIEFEVPNFPVWVPTSQDSGLRSSGESEETGGRFPESQTPSSQISPQIFPTSNSESLKSSWLGGDRWASITCPGLAGLGPGLQPAGHQFLGLIFAQKPRWNKKKGHRGKGCVLSSVHYCVDIASMQE